MKNLSNKQKSVVIAAYGIFALISIYMIWTQVVAPPLRFFLGLASPVIDPKGSTLEIFRREYKGSYATGFSGGYFDFEADRMGCTATVCPTRVTFSFYDIDPSTNTFRVAPYRPDLWVNSDGRSIKLQSGEVYQLPTFDLFWVSTDPFYKP